MYTLLQKESSSDNFNVNGIGSFWKKKEGRIKKTIICVYHTLMYNMHL